MATIDDIKTHMERWRVERSRFRDNNDGGAFEPLDMHMERNAGDWLLVLLAALERQQRFVEAMRKIVYEAENNHHLATNWATSEIAEALAAHDADGAG